MTSEALGRQLQSYNTARATPKFREVNAGARKWRTAKLTVTLQTIDITSSTAENCVMHTGISEAKFSLSDYLHVQ